MPIFSDEFYEAIRAFYRLATLEEAKEYHSRLDRLGKLVNELKEDVDRSIDEMEEYDDDQFSRRTYVRAVFAMIEGAVFALKQEVLEESRIRKIALSPEEIAVLSERSYSLTGSGKAHVGVYYPSLEANIKFAFPIFARVFGETLEFDPPLSEDSGWHSLCKAKKVRDRLMHPKSVEQLEVNDSELNDVKDAAEWIEDQLDRVGEISWERALRILSQIDDQAHSSEGIG
jgi:hypothetical protein